MAWPHTAGASPARAQKVAPSSRSLLQQGTEAGLETKICRVPQGFSHHDTSMTSTLHIALFVHYWSIWATIVPFGHLRTTTYNTDVSRSLMAHAPAYDLVSCQVTGRSPTQVMT